jgi:alkaline phosphatase D
MPIREDARVRDARIYRQFRVGQLADLLMLDTRLIGRDQQVDRKEIPRIEDPRRSLLGRAQEEWLFEQLRDSAKRGTRWQMLGQQVMFAPMAPHGAPAGNADAWDGYRPSRDRVVDFLTDRGMKNAIVLTGDVHSSWAYDIAKDPWSGYDRSTGRGTAAVEFVTPSVTSPSGWTAETAPKRLESLKAARPHLHWADGLSHGYVVMNLTRAAVQADFFGVPTIEARTAEERFEKGFVSEHGNPHLTETSSPAK